jgi:hypothetical protein
MTITVKGKVAKQPQHQYFILQAAESTTGFPARVVRQI